jgi:ATP synthase protein I
MPHPEDPSHGALDRLDKRLDAFEAGRAKPVVQAGKDGLGGMGSGYRFLSEVLGGVFVGAAAGWLIDRFAHTGPFGLIGGLLIGTGVAIFVAVRGAMRDASKFEANADPRAEPGPADEEDD